MDMPGTTTPGAVASGRAVARQAWLAEKAAVAKRYRAYALAWVKRRIVRMERRGEIPVDMSLEKYVALRSRLFKKVPEYDDATGKARKSPKERQP